MTIAPIDPAMVGAVTSIATLPTGAPTAVPGLFDSLVASVQEANQGLLASEAAAQALAAGQTDNLPLMLMQLERSRLAFDVVLQVRNKVLEAYQEVMRMQV